MHAFLKQANQTTTAKNNNKMADHFVKISRFTISEWIVKVFRKIGLKMVMEPLYFLYKRASRENIASGWFSSLAI